MDGTTTMQGTEQEVQNTATETQGQQTAESTPEKHYFHCTDDATGNSPSKH